ncbi:MAG: hypothetical protein WBE74_13915, partial [Terracidiphilus sp.]
RLGVAGGAALLGFARGCAAFFVLGKERFGSARVNSRPDTGHGADGSRWCAKARSCGRVRIDWV